MRTPSARTPVDTTVIATTNIEEMTRLEQQRTSSKLLDRIDEIPVNYLTLNRSEFIGLHAAPSAALGHRLHGRPGYRAASGSYRRSHPKGR